MKKKAQLTVFIILGLVLLIAFAFLFYVAYMASKKPGTSEVNAVIDELDKMQFQQYVEQCFDKATDEGLIVLGRQGGVIFKGQPGAIIPVNPESVSFTEGGNNYSVVYKILEPDSCTYTNNLYPCKKGSESPPCLCSAAACGATCNEKYTHNWSIFIRTGDAPFGSPQKSSFQYELCKNWFENQIDRISFGCCIDSRNPQKQNSVQEQLESFIKNQTKSCIKFDVFRNKLNQNISEGTMSVEVSFNQNDVSARLKYPVIIQVSNKKSEKMYDKEIKKQIKFKQMYEFYFGGYHTASAIKNDTQDVAYDITKYFPNNWEVYKYTVGNDTVISVRDLDTKINGTNYVFQFARKNRPPALDAFSFNRKWVNGDLYDVCVNTFNVPVPIEPIAVDPDEETPSYWISFKDGDNIYLNELQTNFESCINPATGNAELRCTSFTPTQNTNFTITIEAKDGQYTDSQDVRILVNDALC